jgi:hypothetical protein
MLVIGGAGLVGGNLLHRSPHHPYIIIPAFHDDIHQIRKKG